MIKRYCRLRKFSRESEYMVIKDLNMTLENKKIDSILLNYLTDVLVYKGDDLEIEKSNIDKTSLLAKFEMLKRLENTNMTQLDFIGVNAEEGANYFLQARNLIDYQKITRENHVVLEMNIRTKERQLQFYSFEGCDLIVQNTKELLIGINGEAVYRRNRESNLCYLGLNRIISMYPETTDYELLILDTFSHLKIEEISLIIENLDSQFIQDILINLSEYNQKYDFFKKALETVLGGIRKNKNPKLLFQFRIEDIVEILWPDLKTDILLESAPIQIGEIDINFEIGNYPGFSFRGLNTAVFMHMLSQYLEPIKVEEEINLFDKEVVAEVIEVLDKMEKEKIAYAFIETDKEFNLNDVLKDKEIKICSSYGFTTKTIGRINVVPIYYEKNVIKEIYKYIDNLDALTIFTYSEVISCINKKIVNSTKYNQQSDKYILSELLGFDFNNFDIGRFIQANSKTNKKLKENFLSSLNSMFLKSLIYLNRAGRFQNQNKQMTSFAKASYFLKSYSYDILKDLALNVAILFDKKGLLNERNVLNGI